ncbi:aminotransferase [Brevundimonas bullata]|uniref:aminotransferase n=1 Tax=Brevundimonas bullata TaxID=13160 RepID=UPI000E09EFC8|nr:aminotransferase [Brevundimonas bullata]WQE35647.1 aminotransferase [Brevundimonas bullata]
MRLNPLFASLPTTVFERMSGLARQHDAVNLGQGFPDGPEPADLLEAAARALRERSNQYPPSRGLPELRAAAADFYNRFDGLALTPENVVVTSGATEAIAAALMAAVTPGDEVVVIEPAYDAYRPLIGRAGGVVRAVSLAPPEWRLTAEALEAAVTPRTRVLVFNNPLNPAGRAFDAAEVEAVASVCRRHDLIAVSDEVWERLVYDDRRHLSLSSVPGMFERTLKIGSAGKLFGLTGWKVGFITGGGALLEAAAKAHQFITFSTPPHLQAAVAEGLIWPTERFVDQAAALARSRDVLAEALKAEGFVVLPSEATYFLCLDLKSSGVVASAVAFADRAVAEHGVAGIPVSAFMSGEAGGGVLRLCFAKPDAVLEEAARRLGKARHGD